MYIDGTLEASASVTGAMPLANYWTFGGIYNPGPTVTRELGGVWMMLNFIVEP
jgi:hypothetical protein